MKNAGNWPIGICSWSLGENLDDIIRIMEQLELTHVHLSLNAAMDSKSNDDMNVAAKQQWTISATMVAFSNEDYSTIAAIRGTGGVLPDLYWEVNRKRVLKAIDLTTELGVKYLEFHFGFLDSATPSEAQKFRDRTLWLADAAADKDIVLLMETGQENAVELRDFLLAVNHPSLAVNFDPGNMILYGSGNPLEAVITLGPWIKNVHCKDAIKSNHKDAWGKETAWGSGDLNTPLFLKTLKKTGFQGTLNIERECGDTRIDDIKKTVLLLCNEIPNR